MTDVEIYLKRIKECGVFLDIAKTGKKQSQAVKDAIGRITDKERFLIGVEIHFKKMGQEPTISKVADFCTSQCLMSTADVTHYLTDDIYKKKSAWVQQKIQETGDNRVWTVKMMIRSNPSLNELFGLTALHNARRGDEATNCKYSFVDRLSARVLMTHFSMTFDDASEAYSRVRRELEELKANDIDTDITFYADEVITN